MVTYYNDTTTHPYLGAPRAQEVELLGRHARQPERGRIGGGPVGVLGGGRDRRDGPVRGEGLELGQLREGSRLDSMPIARGSCYKQTSIQLKFAKLLSIYYIFISVARNLKI